VTNAHNDSLSVFDAESLKLLREVPIRIPELETLRGVMPIGVTFDPKSGRLLVAEAGINAIAVIDPERGAVLGHIPSAWFPTRVAVHDSMVYAAAAKGFGTGPNAANGKFHTDLRRGALTMFPLPADSELKAHTEKVFANAGLTAVGGTERNPLPDALKYAVIIVKENRTFDEVFGDISGSPALARFGQKVSPNHHEMARRWAYSDNFYADSEVSVDGHHWLVGSYPNAWTESTLMAAYGGQKDFRIPTTAPGRLLFAGSDSSVHPEEQLEGGTIWHHLERHKITFRNFGEGTEIAGLDEGPGLKPTGGRYFTNMPIPDPLYRNTSRNYPVYNTNIPDQFRAKQFIAEMQGVKKLPKLIFIHLPDDHTSKPRPQDGYPSIASYVSDNDYALGRIVEYLSSRPEWKQMAVFVTEDDSQGGVDHVDSHRTVLMIASPYAKRGYVAHRNSSFPGMLKTVFKILRIPALNLYDATATDLTDAFTDQADFAPYKVLPVSPDIFIPENAKDPKDPRPSEAMDDPRVLKELKNH
jgi:hypothetical protein